MFFFCFFLVTKKSIAAVSPLLLSPGMKLIESVFSDSFLCLIFILEFRSVLDWSEVRLDLIFLNRILRFFLFFGCRRICMPACLRVCVFIYLFNYYNYLANYS